LKNWAGSWKDCDRKMSLLHVKGKVLRVQALKHRHLVRRHRRLGLLAGQNNPVRK
jgi:hypothetical protein